MLGEVLYRNLWRCFEWWLSGSLRHPVVVLMFGGALANHVWALAIETFQILPSETFIVAISHRRAPLLSSQDIHWYLVPFEIYEVGEYLFFNTILSV